ncbi:hypothetical protein L596_023019 [Steinernema carpocapsae]|uniref:ShKT domain-containing protein n=1 Tax=Steinernema carpocapsae TaxID=34508 RepID=A0A4U5MCC5_STECR|nr:hypothetical protein L596_023019 [Steinernema carpocapsae]
MIRTPDNRPKMFSIHYHRQCFDTADDCPPRAELCDHFDHVDLMTQECRRTCNRCETVSDQIECVDKVPTAECQKKKDKCDLSSMYDTMSQLCAATCKRCCGDSNERCKLMAELGYCSNHMIPFEQRKENCAKTCGWC